MDLNAANVAAVNKANAYANKLYALLAPVFKELIGQQILKADGKLLAKVEKLLPELPNTIPLTVYRKISQSTLSWEIKATVDESATTWASGCASLIMGRMEDGRLMELSESPQLCENFNVKEITAMHDRIRALRNEINDINGSIEPFTFRY